MQSSVCCKTLFPCRGVPPLYSRLYLTYPGTPLPRACMFCGEMGGKVFQHDPVIRRHRCTLTLRNAPRLTHCVCVFTNVCVCIYVCAYLSLFAFLCVCLSCSLHGSYTLFTLARFEPVRNRFQLLSGLIEVSVSAPKSISKRLESDLNCFP